MLALPLAWIAAAADADGGRLLEIQREIRHGQEKLASSRAAYERLQYRVAASEREISDLARLLRDSERKLREAQAEVDALQRRAASLSRESRAALAALGAELRALHRDGDLGELRYQLSLDDWRALARRNVYSDYFRAARRTRLARIRGELSELAAVRAVMTDKKAALARERRQRRRRLQMLAREQAERDQARAELRREIERTRGGIALLEKNAARLRGLVERLDEAPASRQTRFPALKGRLPWPAGGAVRKRGSIHRGVFVEVAAETPVRSIHDGRVVFSDWIRGYGLMVIVDHGAGYMSLYGNNGALYKGAGDAVRAGEQLATTTAAAARGNGGLYFEIRHRGKPLDPRRWCR